MKGEAIASGSEHADNVAPAIMGGITLVRSSAPLDIIKIESPSELYATVIHPQIELKTSEMRAVLQPMIPLKSAILQFHREGNAQLTHNQKYKTQRLILPSFPIAEWHFLKESLVVKLHAFLKF